MEELKYSSASERLSALMDGELDTSESPQLFYELASNPDLQDEMRDMLTVRRLINKNKPYPPDKLKHNILKTAGLAVSADLTNSGNGSVNSPIGKIVKSRWFTALSAAVLGSIATFYFLGLFQPAQYIFGESSIGVAQASEQNERTIPIAKSQEIYQRAQISKMPESTEQTVAVIEAEPAPEKYILINNSIPANSLGNAIIPGNLHSQALIIGNLPKSSVSGSGKFLLELRGFTAASFPRPDIAPLSEPAMNNIGAALLYKISDEHYAGIEIGQENFLQSYKGFQDGLPVVYDQNYLGFWGALVYQYNSNYKMLSELSPFFKFSAGATEVGPIGKTIIGLMYDLSENFALFAGAEGSLLLYRYQNKFWTTRKLGATGGFSIRF